MQPFSRADRRQGQLSPSEVSAVIWAALQLWAARLISKNESFLFSGGCFSKFCSFTTMQLNAYLSCLEFTGPLRSEDWCLSLYKGNFSCDSQIIASLSFSLLPPPGIFIRNIFKLLLVHTLQSVFHILYFLNFFFPLWCIWLQLPAQVSPQLCLIAQ